MTKRMGVQKISYVIIVWKLPIKVAGYSTRRSSSDRDSPLDEKIKKPPFLDKLWGLNLNSSGTYCMLKLKVAYPNLKTSIFWDTLYLPSHHCPRPRDTCPWRCWAAPACEGRSPWQSPGEEHSHSEQTEVYLYRFITLYPRIFRGYLNCFWHRNKVLY